MVSPAQWRLLRLKLRGARVAADLSQGRLAELLRWSESAVQRIEAGTTARPPTETEVAAWTAVLGLPKATQDELIALCRAAQSTGWIADLRGLPDQLRTLMDYEQHARTSSEVATMIVPGLLQTEEYMRAVFAAGGVPEAEIPKRVELRKLRQRVVGGGSLHVVGLLNESVLREVYRSPEVTAAQLVALLELAQRPTVTVLVIPSAAHFKPVNGSYAVLEFESGPPVIYDEHVSGGTFLEESRQVEAVIADLARLRSVALGEHESAELITSAITKLEGV